MVNLAHYAEIKALLDEVTAGVDAQQEIAGQGPERCCIMTE